MKFLKRILFAFFLLLFSLFVFLFVISRFYHKKAEQYIVAELNKHLASVVSIEDIKLDPFSKFPHISLTMSNSVVYVPGKEKTEKLMEFEKLFFMFSITDLFTSNYC
jgi:hypothetical protein